MTPPDFVKATAGVTAVVLAVVTVLSVCAVSVVPELLYQSWNQNFKSAVKFLLSLLYYSLYSSLTYYFTVRPSLHLTFFL